MKKDIFNGKIKKEYVSYVLGYMIFFVLLFVGVGVLCICACAWGMTTNTAGERLLIALLGVISFALACVYLFLELLVIRKFPKYQKIRRMLFNSDCYFTESNSNEYYGSRRRKYRAAFELVTAIAQVERGMGDKKPVRYTVYGALSLVMSVLGLVDLLAMPLLFENGTILPNVSDEVFLLLYFSVGCVCIALAVFFLLRALKVGMMAPLERDQWIFELYTALADIAVRQNRKNNKCWYKTEQIAEIEDMVRVASEQAKCKVHEKNGKPRFFTVIDSEDDRVVFTGYFL